MGPVAPRTKYAQIAQIAWGTALLGIFSIVPPAIQASAHTLPSLLLSNNQGAYLSSSSVSLSENSQTIALLQAAVNVDPNPAKGGGDITIVDDSALLPDVGLSGNIAEIESNLRQGKVSLYTVHSGDTVNDVAKMFGVTPNTILWANDLPKGSALRVGQTLAILPVDGVQYTIQRGDTLQGLAKRFSGNLSEIMSFNDLTPNSVLSIGDTLIIPGGVEGVTVKTSVSSSGSGITTSRARIIAAYPRIDGYYKNPLPTGHRTQGLHGFNGVDIGASRGDAIHAAAEGIVVVSHFAPGDPWFGGYGNYVVVEHPNGTQTLYAHMSAVYVSIGAHVDQGQIIGAVGNTGHSTGPHLHFEVRGAKNPGADWSWAN